MVSVVSLSKWWLFFAGIKVWYFCGLAPKHNILYPLNISYLHYWTLEFVDPLLFPRIWRAKFSTCTTRCNPKSQKSVPAYNCHLKVWHDGWPWESLFGWSPWPHQSYYTPPRPIPTSKKNSIEGLLGWLALLIMLGRTLILRYPLNYCSHPEVCTVITFLIVANCYNYCTTVLQEILWEKTFTHFLSLIPRSHISR